MMRILHDSDRSVLGERQREKKKKKSITLTARKGDGSFGRDGEAGVTR